MLDDRHLAALARYRPYHNPTSVRCLVPSPLRLVVIVKSNGRREAKLHCPDCMAVGGAIPYSLINPAEHPELPILRSHLTDAPCERCRSTSGVELHHWAPRALFGFEADDWPTSNLCPACHSEWHRVMRKSSTGTK